MTNSVRFNRARTRASRGPAMALCLTLLASVLAMSALAAPAGARERSRRTAHTSVARRDVGVARHAPTRLAVMGTRLVWSAVSGAQGYVVRRRVDGRETRRTLTAATAVSLRASRGATVVYSVRTDVPGSAWSPPITIVYNRLGEISKVYGEGAGSGETGSGSSPSEESSPSEAGSAPVGGSGSGGGSGSKSGGEGSGETTTPEPEGTTEGQESGQEVPVSGGEGSHPSALKVGLVGGVYGWGASASETIRKTTGVKYTKLGVGSEGWGTVKEMVGDGITPLLLYNPTLAGMSPAAVAEGVKAYVSHMHELGLTEIELGNEVYFHGSTPWEYAAQYRAAHEALAGSGITLIADAWTDTPKPNGQWSQWEYGGGWCVLFVQTLGYVPDAWSFHPYGPMKADGFGSGAYQTGWATVPRMISYMKADHIYAPLNITEVGQPTYRGDDGNAAVSEAEQAQDVKQYIRQVAEWGLASLYLYEAIDTPEGGYGLYKWPLKAKPSAAAFAEALAEISTPGVNAKLDADGKASLIT